MTNKQKNIKGLKKPLITFLLSLMVTVICVVALFSMPINATQTQPPATTATTELPYEKPLTDDQDEGLLGLLNPGDSNNTLDLVLMITILSLAPSILIMMTSFTRIVIVFSLLRNAMGVQQTPPNQVLIGLALFLTLFIMAPVVTEMNTVAYKPYKAGEITTIEAVKKASVPLKKFMLQQTSSESMEFFLDLSGKEMPQGTPDEISEEIGLEAVAPAFIISEIKKGFTVGFLLFIPFLIIDIVVSSTLMSLGMIMLPPAMISLPFKINFLNIFDGWQLLVGKLVEGFY
ncbi:MAG: flagellar type III secretion system pore protein FliP [Oscillospiraceae bacterium]